MGSKSLDSMFRTEAEVDEQMTRPSEAVINQLSKGSGNLVCLGAGGKMGPTLAILAANAIKRAGLTRTVFAVSRYSNRGIAKRLESCGVRTIQADLLDRDSVAALPDATDVIFMAGRKFGSTGAEGLTWAMNTYMPAIVAQRFSNARIVVFSTGNVYPFTLVTGNGASEETMLAPVGDYAQSCLGRERIFQHFSEAFGTRVCVIRLNYAIDVRYGVLLDIGRQVFKRDPIDVSMGHVNVIWQGEACDRALQCLGIASDPPAILNVTGTSVLSVRWIADRFGECFDLSPRIIGIEGPTALLSDASQCTKLFGPLQISVGQMIVWVADWLKRGGITLEKPTGYEVRDGRF